MGRSYATVAGLTYSDLDSALQHLGYVRSSQPEQTVYEYPGNGRARLIYSPFVPDEYVRGIDLFAARKIVDSFGIVEAKDFDLLLVRLTEGRVVFAH